MSSFSVPVHRRTWLCLAREDFGSVASTLALLQTKAPASLDSGQVALHLNRTPSPPSLFPSVKLVSLLVAYEDRRSCHYLVHVKFHHRHIVFFHLRVTFPVPDDGQLHSGLRVGVVRGRDTILNPVADLAFWEVVC